MRSSTRDTHDNICATARPNGDYHKSITKPGKFMKLGIYFDLRNPLEWRQDWSRVYGFALEMCEEAERLGADSVWDTEHHLFDDGYMTQPLTFLAAVAARTKRMRLGTAIMIAPLRPAVQIAEEAAMVDLLSGGRLDLGLGAGYRVPEYQLYGADIQTRFATLDNRVRELRTIWAEGRLTPMPVQAPLPIWMGYQGPKGARRAGLLGEGLLAADAALYPHYRQGLIDGGHDAATARMAGSAQIWATEDPGADWPVVSKHLANQVNSYLRHAVEGTDQPIPRPIDPERLRLKTLGVGSPLGSVFCGTPSDAAAQVKKYTSGAPVETMIFWASIAGMPERMVANNVQTLCTKLKPLLAEAV
jgi:alkanesulfonate monooxygenase SsuD/methylene tetrahydromethanopterin reductase-like flavin-dependent oxidoreductase (luciferase family)